MKLAPLHARFIEEFSRELPEWNFIATHRHFRKRFPDRNLLAHVAFINHVGDFDAAIDVAVEFLIDRKPVCIIGAELGNIEGGGQIRHSVFSEESASLSAREGIAHLKRVGFPFLERFSIPNNALTVLRAGGSEARLISPLTQLHSKQIAALERIATAG